MQPNSNVNNRLETAEARVNTTIDSDERIVRLWLEIFKIKQNDSFMKFVNFVLFENCKQMQIWDYKLL